MAEKKVSFIDISDEQCAPKDNECGKATQEAPFIQKREALSFEEEKSFYWVRKGFLLVTSAISLVLLVVYALHLVLADKYRWLTQSNMQDIQDIVVAIFVGISISIVSTYFFKKK